MCGAKSDIFQYRATGYLSAKIAKVAACTLGGGIILVEIARQTGAVKLNWDKIDRKMVDKISEAVEVQVAGPEEGWVNKVHSTSLDIFNTNN